MTGLNKSVEKTAIGLHSLFDPIREDLEQVERAFERHVQSHVGVIPEIGRYIQSGGGKRVRPAVLLMAARLAGYRGERAVLHASVIEFIHTATLVHDDIIDNSELRRGQAAVHSRWGNDVTVLLGDYLYIKSLALALTEDSLDIIRLLCEVTLRMIEGEIYQLTKNGDVDISEDEHLEIIRRKTAYLFAGCSEIGGMLGGAAAGQRDALREYGFNLGTAFQLIDDVLDLTSDPSTLGKPVGNDLREGKMTLPLIYLLRVSERASEPIRAVVRDRELTPERWAVISSLLAEHGALDYAARRAEAYSVRARQALEAFPRSPERDALVSLAEFVVSRDR
ncbi:MAG: polyprenyl synthetase family protein [Vicinamibacterales bacterium]